MIFLILAMKKKRIKQKLVFSQICKVCIILNLEKTLETDSKIMDNQVNSNKMQTRLSESNNNYIPSKKNNDKINPISSTIHTTSANNGYLNAQKILDNQKEKMNSINNKNNFNIST